MDNNRNTRIHPFEELSPREADELFAALVSAWADLGWPECTCDSCARADQSPDSAGELEEGGKR